MIMRIHQLAVSAFDSSSLREGLLMVNQLPTSSAGYRHTKFNYNTYHGQYLMKILFFIYLVSFLLPLLGLLAILKNDPKIYVHLTMLLTPLWTLTGPNCQQLLILKL